MENLSKIEPEKHLVPYEQSLALATELYKKYHDELMEASFENFGNSNIDKFLDLIPKEIQKEFIGHGITRGAGLGNLASFINILDNSTIKGSSAPLAGGYGSYTQGRIFILSHFKKPLFLRKLETEREYIMNEIGLVSDIGAYVISCAYYPILDELKKLYPDKNIIRADEIPKYIENETGIKLVDKK